ncbi:SAVED domain-containing protein [Clostridium perfringens]|uniref:SAVED domain-containing protein n=1 Tax=Clostridium perfringens TaxID=1502 RepID=UPI001CCCFF13|nr:SAVED domain-containing protein [Clostridium perfringens]MDK0930100.1 SAVED domain-containing protein [Clostridium perfringens]MDM0703345.1 SAVED domain-containing protein [Clostridium perfringens]UBK41847.1 SAVED domain-containing protein [Clostridium perfringens]
MLVIDTKILDKLIEMCNLIIKNPWKSVILAIILLLLAFIITIIVYRKSKIIQKAINFITSLFFPLIKKDKVVMAIFSKNQAVFKNVLNEYCLVGYKKFQLGYIKEFEKGSEISELILQKIIDKQYKVMTKIKKGIKNKDSLVYLGFPHVPIAFLDGKNFSKTDNTILYEYNGSLANSSDKDFFELKNIYNSEIKLTSNYNNIILSGDEVALKIEQSFLINDTEIKNVVGSLPIIYLRNNEIKRWEIESYADVDIIVKEFNEILKFCKSKGIKKIHLFLTTPVSLTFSLGKVVEHYHPNIIIYNYNNNKFDWCIDCSERKVIKI